MAKDSGRSGEQMKFSVFMLGNSNYRVGGWRLPGAYTDAGRNIDRWIEIARRMEAAKLDMLFVADGVGVFEIDRPEVFARSTNGERLEPLITLAALSSVTTHLGLAATMITSYAEPYDVARKIASLDLVSGGRAGWNIVTGGDPADAAQYSVGYPDPSERYARGEEFVDVVTALWASVEPDAYPRDQASGIYADPSKVHVLNHKGAYYSVKGPLSVEPSPQGRPILIQAGQSEEGRALAARVADVIFTSQSSFDPAKEFYDDVKSRAAAAGRDPDAVKVMPGVMMVVGRTAEEADEKEALLNTLVDPSVGLAKLQLWLQGIDLSQYPLDGPFPELPPSASRGRGMNYVTMAREENLTLREVSLRAAASNAHWAIKGSPAQIADQLEHWFRDGAADGFNLLLNSVPEGLDDFTDLVLPELQRRGLFRTEYEGRTLRENLGIPVPSQVR